MKNIYFPFLYAVLAFLIVKFIIGFDGLYGQDSYEYLRYSKLMSEFLMGGEHPGNFFWGNGYPLLVSIISVIGFSEIFTMQLVSFLSLLGIIYYTTATIKISYDGEKSSLIAYSITVILSPYLLRASIIGMSDLVAVFCITASFYYGILYSLKKSLKLLTIFTFFSCFAMFTRYPAAVPLVPISFYLVLVWIASKKWKHVIVLIIPLLFIIIHFFLKKENPESFIVHEWIEKWSLLNLFISEFDTTTGYFNYTLINIFYAMSPFAHLGFISIGAFLILTYLKGYKTYLNNNISKVILISIMLNAIFLAGIPYQNKRFLLLTLPLVFVFIYPAFDTLYSYFEKRKLFNLLNRKLMLIGIFLLNICLSIYVIRPLVKLNNIERKIMSVVLPYQGNILYALGMDISLMGRGVNFDYKGLWAQNYKSFKIGGLVLFNEEKFAKQWEGKYPMNNWSKLKADYKLKLLNSFDEGWNLYEIKEK